MFYVYKLTSPSGKCYIGFTGQAVKDRWRQHIHRSDTGYKHPLYSAMRKYGAESFTVETLGEYETAEEALQAEIDDIAALGGRKYSYNLSPGGENDGPTGVAALRAKRQDPEWEVEYRKRISEGVRKSELHMWRRPKIGEIYIQWRKENPKEAWKNTHRALRMAAKAPRGSREGYTVSPESAKKTGAGVREFWKNAPPSVRKRKSIQTRESAKKVWAERGEQARAEVGAKISETHKERYANMDSRTKQELDAQLAAARDAIDRKKQGAAASRGLKAYWENLKKDPEAYAAVQAAKAATRASKRAQQCS